MWHWILILHLLSASGGDQFIVVDHEWESKADCDAVGASAIALAAGGSTWACAQTDFDHTRRPGDHW